MTDETRADRTETTELGTEAETVLLHAQDDPVASAAVDAAVETELLEAGDFATRAAVEAEWLAAKRESDRQIGELDPTDQDRVRRLQRELRALGVDVWPVARWWGFEIHMNEAGALRAAEVADKLGEVSGTVLGAWLAPIVEWSVRNKSGWITTIARPYGVKLVSPWTAPATVVPARPAGTAVGDSRLYWTVFEPGEGWSPDQRFVDHFSVSGPAVAEFQDRLYIAHRGTADDSSLWWTVYDAEEGWSEAQKFPKHFSDAGPALAAYDGQLYCVHRGNGGDGSLWWTRWDGSRWTPDAKLPKHSTGTSPALAAYDGQLYCVHRGNGDDAALWWTRWDGKSWSADQRFPNHTTAANPALASYRGHLYCVHRGNGDDAALWWTRWDGKSWSADQRLPGHLATGGPALTVYKDRLYCVHRGGSDQSLWWACFDGSTWSGDERLPDHYSAESPAAIAFRDKNATRDQLLCLHRGTR
ncbi:hypothetical protein ITP53_08085 [Nonomuraea sp. K274]|uniref:Uncharacterized protein n=1 Tax=Nonomuraea cypriaca TaxID=1187855 RepID=A0A931A3Q9_9ACTN|nr:hypothetical protein [Nonomuraea cypriaca]MBF8185697.1 hypothetical protein [Nonomuraea cypriaca]